MSASGRRDSCTQVTFPSPLDYRSSPLCLYGLRSDAFIAVRVLRRRDIVQVLNMNESEYKADAQGTRDALYFRLDSQSQLISLQDGYPTYDLADDCRNCS
jgi:hypothetical protein